jgi:hypothetical protein
MREGHVKEEMIDKGCSYHGGVLDEVSAHTNPRQGLQEIHHRADGINSKGIQRIHLSCCAMQAAETTTKRLMIRRATVSSRNCA